MKTFTQWLEDRKVIDAEVKAASEKLKEFDKHRTSSGMYPKEIRDTPEFKKAEKEFNIAFSKLQKFNKASPKEYMRQASQLKRQNKL